MKILIIDDSEDDRLLYRRALQQDKFTAYEISEAEDGEEGLAAISSVSPDCVLLDYSLPGRNGIEVLKRIRSQYPFVPVVMLTGQGNEAIAVNAIHEGAQNYITKSAITPEAIERIIRIAIEHCAMEKRIYEQRTALEIFTRALAHDLKEPVRTIKSFMDLLADHTLFSDKEKSYVTYVQNAADRMGTLIDTVYFYTRLDAMPEQIQKETCNVSAVLGEVKENIRQLIEERNAVITHEALPDVFVNRMHLLQVLQNLVCNAIRHCDKESPAIHVEAMPGEQEWLIRVTDNGAGVEEMYRQQIFEPFKRAVRHKEQGLGLGLAICKKIVESYGGKIWYEPAPVRGATFLFTLPQAPGEASKASVAQKNGNGKKIAERSPDNIASILLVEDSEADIELTKILLLQRQHLSCHLLVAHDVSEALTMMQLAEVENRRIDLMLLDINMPGMDGFELLKRMHEEETMRSIPVVMCTTSTYDKDIEKAKALGAVGYLNKPAELSKLKPVIDKLSGIELEKENEGYVLRRAV